VRQVQQRLNAVSFNAGNIDGTWNQQTAQAAADFQRSKGLDPTGTLPNALQLGAIMNCVSGTGQGLPVTAGGQGASMRFTQEHTVADGVPIRLSPAQIRVIERALNAAGFDAGQVRGTWTRQTAAATENYQRSKGLEPIGSLDLSLLAALQLGPDFLMGEPAALGVQDTMRWAQETTIGQGVPLFVSTAGIRAVETSLNQAGFDAGNLDGIWDEQTGQAVARSGRKARPPCAARPLRRPSGGRTVKAKEEDMVLRRYASCIPAVTMAPGLAPRGRRWHRPVTAPAGTAVATDLSAGWTSARPWCAACRWR
jgi:peptidoglycan hydrolase-like protein with peptidoglycan-binding domain